MLLVGAASLILAFKDVSAEVSDTAYRGARDAITEAFRATGAMPGANALQMEAQIAAALQGAPPDERAGLLYDLGAIRRLRGDFAGAVESFAAAIADAAPAQRALVFDAWIGTARAHAYGLDDHGAAAAALERAASVAGAAPPRAMAHELDAFAAQIASIRGDVQDALIRNLAAGVTADSELEHFYVHFDRGGIFQQFAQRCDYEPLIDARTFAEEPVELWGGCFRAVDRAAESYTAAREIAAGAGWHALAGQVDGVLAGLRLRAGMIRMQSTGAETVAGVAFDGATVLVDERFPAGASELPGTALLTTLIDTVTSEDDGGDPRSQWLRGARADLAGDPAAALAHFTRAADLLAAERASYFDLRRTGTVVEDQPEVVRDLGLRLLHHGRHAEALAVFELLRAHGMSELYHVLARLEPAAPARDVIAEMLELEARIDAERAGLVQEAIGTGTIGTGAIDPSPALAAIAGWEGALRDLRQAPASASILSRLRSVTPPPPPDLAALEAAVRDSGVSVLLYWSAPTYLVVWPVTEAGSAPRAVFLPQTALLGHVEKILRGSESRFAPFPIDSARALHAFLVDPVRDLLHGDEVMIVPQGPLVGLPFEALVDTESGRYLVETHTVSYAPNVDFALRALASRPAPLDRVAAVADPQLATGELDRLPPEISLRVHASDALEAGEALAALTEAPISHVLLHGRFGRQSPLLSTLAMGGADVDGQPRTLTAAQLVAADWRSTRLAVLSSCEGALTQVRLSGELHGLSWPLLVGGAEALVVSRWRVEGTSNADWIRDFYGELVSSGRPARAAAAASRAMIARGQDHPFFWAGPQVLGR